jgi:alpha-2-macroglobulin
MSLALPVLLWGITAQAFVVERITPDATVSRVETVTARFSEQMVALGSQAVTPLEVRCKGAADNAAATQGEGRWVNEREWSFRFKAALPPGLQCAVKLKPTLQSTTNTANTGKSEFTFSTGGPIILRTWPDSYQSIDERQIFVLQLNGAADANSIAEHTQCTTNKVGEQIGVELVSGKERDEVLAYIDERQEQRRGRAKAKARPIQADTRITLRCKLALGEDAKVTLNWGAVKTTSGVANREIQRLNFNTRASFRATYSCEREQSSKPCIPVRPITVNFSSDVPWKLARELRLTGPGAARTPRATDRERNEALPDDAVVRSVEFAPPFSQEASYELKLPANFIDNFERKLANSDAFPMKIATGPAPALAKFAARFGIVERAVGVLPVTVRNIESPLAAKRAELSLRSRKALTDEDIAKWLQLAEVEESREWALRSEPLLASSSSAQALPPIKTGKDTEVIGIPLTEPGLHLVEIESPALGAALFTDKEQKASTAMYVRAYALLTGMAVHIKTSEENAAVWVTSLETGKPIAQAQVQVSDCNGKSLWKGVTDASGQARINEALPRAKCALKAADIAKQFDRPALASDERFAGRENERGWLLATARKDGDMSFAITKWNNGIEPWRFNVQQVWRRYGETANVIAHTIFARNLLRQGETVHMKHLVRLENARGLTRPAKELFKEAQIEHIGSNQTFKVPLKWLNSGAATSEWRVPAEGKLGNYRVSLLKRADTAADKETAAQRTARLANNEHFEDGEGGENSSGDIEAGGFQVAQFRLPVMQGTITSSANLNAPKSLPVTAQLNYLNGGAAAGLAVNMSAVMRPHYASFSGYDEFSFTPSRGDLSPALLKLMGDAAPEEEEQTTNDRLLLDKAPLKLDDKGSAKQDITVPPLRAPQNLRAEINYRDPNGEIQTIGQSFTLWPSKVVLGIKQGSWFGDGAARTQRFVALDTQGKPVSGVPVSVRAASKQYHSVRKRVVGGFYSYDSRDEVNDLGEVCAGKSDVQGMFVCELSGDKLKGNVQLLANAKDSEGNNAWTTASLWIDRADFFKPDDSDRMDVLAEKRNVAAGDVAKLQVRLPFERATAWVAVEREGVIDTFVMELERSKPVIEVPIKGEYAPNVMVSVLAVRPRLEPLSWWSFFQWGWRSPMKWWETRKRSLEPPTAMVDLAKPAYRFGLVELQVDAAGNSLKVEVSATPDKLQAREATKALVKVTRPDGKPAANAEVAIAVVDEALLELKANESWDLLAGLWRKRGYGVETATAQMQVIGKRHFGLKAQPAGGGGGRSGTRELLETLAYWNPAVKLDAQGRAEIPFNVNDALTKFRVVVLADLGGGLLGTGKSFVTVSKDLQVISGLPPLVRDEDNYTAGVTLRNTTARAMKVAFKATPDPVEAGAFEKTVEIAAQSNVEVTWPVALKAGQQKITWLLNALETSSAAKPAQDALKLTQRVAPAVNTTVWAVTLLRPEPSAILAVALPEGALPDRGGVKASFASSIIGSLTPLQLWWEQYPFYCLEQRTSKAVGTRDQGLWKIITEALPTYLDSDGLANYFPGDNRGISGGGSDTLTAYVLSASQASGWVIPQEPRDRMLQGLTAFVEGKLQRNYWSPIKSDEVRRINALEALSRYGKATPAMLSTVNVTPNVWPTSALIDWIAIVQRVETPKREQWLSEATTVLRARMNFNGTRITFDDEKRDDWWWLMTNADVNAAKLVLAAMDNKLGIAEWLQDMPRLVNGLVARQERGVWHTTTANLWGTLALEVYAKKFEREPVTGQTALSANAGAESLADWKAGAADAVLLQWAKSGKADVKIEHKGGGKPYVTVQALAAVPEPLYTNGGYRITKTLVPVSQKTAGKWARGDVYRVEIEVDAAQQMTWVALTDPIPAGSTVLGTGLRDSEAEKLKSEKAASKPDNTQDWWNWAWLAYEERGFEGYRAYYEYMPKGKTKLSYTVRLNQPGEFKLPATRAEAMYAPEVFGVLPNAKWVIGP